jgi:hypothetical protein
MGSHFGHAIFFNFRTLDVLKEGAMALYPHRIKTAKAK